MDISNDRLGPNTIFEHAVYGPIGETGPAYIPESYCCFVMWVDASGQRIWVFTYGDLWKYERTYLS